MSYSLTLGGIRFPVAPLRVEKKYQGRSRTVDLLDGTQTVIGKPPSLCGYTVKLLLPQTDYPFASYPEGFRDPSYYLTAVEEMAKSGTAVSLVIVRDAHREEKKVYVSDIHTDENAENGDDLILSLSFRESERQDASVGYTEGYTVRAGDTLRSIAKRIWGDESLWRYLYGYNVDAIEAAAKKQGYADSRFGERLAVGLSLIIPEGVG